VNASQSRAASTLASDGARAVPAIPSGRVGDTLLRGAVLAGIGPADVRIHDGQLTDVAQTLDLLHSDTALDLAGFVLLPGLVEPHAHLDKALTADRVGNPTGDLPGAVEAWLAFRPGLTAEDIAARARSAALRYLANGATLVQTHVDTGADIGLRGIEALIAVREELAGLLDLRIVACGMMPIGGSEGAANRAVLASALTAGADAVGGAPALDEDPAGAIDALLDLAARFGLAVDLHTDETLDPEVLTLRLLVERVRAGFPHRVTASHCVSLGAQPPAVQDAIAAGLAEARIGIVTLPITNLYLQGRHPTQPAPRGLTAIRALLAAGVTVAAGGDNLRDPFNPVGRADPLEAASLLVTAGHLSPNAALTAITEAGRAVTGAQPVRLRVGDPADLLAVRAESVGDAIGAAHPDRIVIRDGRIVARSSLTVEFAWAGVEAFA
jgi:cytosine deaminase